MLNKFSFPFLIIFLFLSCSQKPNEEQSVQTASKVAHTVEETKIANRKSLKFYFTPSLRASRLATHISAIKSFLTEHTEYEYSIVIPESYDAMILDFHDKKADFAFMNTLSYVIASKESGIKARLRSLKYGQSTYRGQIIANMATGIQTIKDIQGKKFAYTSKSSTSGFLFPAKMLKDAGVVPKEIIFSLKHDDVVETVYRRMAHAGATYYSEPADDGQIRDARAKLKDKYPDIEEKVKIIALTPPIPNDPVVFATHVSEEVINDVCQALIDFSNTKSGKKILTDLYGTDGFIKCTDADYKSMFEVVEVLQEDMKL